ncbi:hypothetical protein SH1V18_45400 [Vallitalea longa]|uniref:PurM-like N-terminal domain-containing protein n=1 Tax=Vallitalea longa TaxID=2936439 RepID=A0A9W5YGH2_9FIRM|nr:AIR synthase related protein [Vallitalea longa]GKX32060.1 hypothetical protein SH1V18_45400 [Vallitalea longa]
MIKKFRDITLISFDNENVLTVACDSCGGIGNKEHDVIKVDPYITGYYTAIVSLSETIALGAEPITVINTFAVEMKDTGKRILDGIYAALDEIEVDKESVVTGSTEENIPVTVTGIGLTVIGKVNMKNWNYPKAKSGNIVVAVGIPKVGNEVVGDKGEIMTLKILKRIKSLNFIEDVLPVGSKGISYEAGEMARTSNLEFRPCKDVSLDLNKTAGPATCAVVAMDSKHLEDLKQMMNIPVNVVGEFI